MKERFKKIIYIVIYIGIYFRLTGIRVLRKNNKCIIFISTPLHGNLGDHAIVYAQYKMMKSIGGKDNIIEITRPSYEQLKDKLQRIIKPQDIIIIDGGGNIGTLWIQEENKMRDIIERFCSNPIFIFPQTAYFEDSEWGRDELKKSIEIYEKHPHLTVFCRDKGTYELLQTKFSKVKSIYTPDTVLYIDDLCTNEKERKGILFCFRDDKEGIDNGEIQGKLYKMLVKKGYAIDKTSTLVSGRVYRWTRIKQLKKKWKEFSNAELVITDRLHGMIFCTITGTKCVALDNISHKVRDGYSWIKYLPYISFYDNSGEQDLEAVVEECLNTTETIYNRIPLEGYFKEIEKEVKDAFN